MAEEKQEIKALPVSLIYSRRFKVFGLMILSTVLATLKWVSVIPTDSLLTTKILMTVLFILTFAWIALFFWSSIFGFWNLLRKKDVPGIFWVSEATPIKARTAILMPVYNESPTGTFANLTAIAKDLENIGHEKNFDIFSFNQLNIK